MSNPNRDDKGRYATWWKGLASFGALVLLWALFASGVMGYHP